MTNLILMEVLQTQKHVWNERNRHFQCCITPTDVIMQDKEKDRLKFMETSHLKLKYFFRSCNEHACFTQCATLHLTQVEMNATSDCPGKKRCPTDPAIKGRSKLFFPIFLWVCRFNRANRNPVIQQMTLSLDSCLSLKTKSWLDLCSPQSRKCHSRS